MPPRPIVGPLALVLLGACAHHPTPVPPAPPADTMNPHQQLVRVSLLLRGVRPSLAEHRRLRADPEAFSTLVAEFVDSQGFAATLRQWHAEQLLIDVSPDGYPAGFPALDELAPLGTHALNRSLIESPLRLIEDVVMRDQPYGDILRADYALADPVVATVWGMRWAWPDATGPDLEPSRPERRAPWTDLPPGWARSRYQDGRVHAGILSDAFLFTRHESTESNKNRGRAARLARALLCLDYADRPVHIDQGLDLSDEEAVLDATRSAPACVSCHQTLDPLAAFFQNHHPLIYSASIERYPVRSHTPEFGAFMAVAPRRYFGQPGAHLGDLGRMMAADSRFARCAVRRVMGRLEGRPPEHIPLNEILPWVDWFQTHDLDYRGLVTALASRPGEQLLRVDPHQLSAQFEDLTGFVWESDLWYDLGGGPVGPVDLTTDVLFGYRTLLGGPDSYDVPSLLPTVHATTVLGLTGLAERAAARVVPADFARPPGERRLLQRVEPETRDEAAIRAQLAELELRLFGSWWEPDDPALDPHWALWSGALALSGSTEDAWILTLSGLLGDSRMVLY